MTDAELHEAVKEDYRKMLRDYAELEVEDFDAACLPKVPLHLCVMLQNGCHWQDFLDGKLDWCFDPGVEWRKASHFPELNCSYFCSLAAIKLLGFPSLPPID